MRPQRRWVFLSLTLFSVIAAYALRDVIYKLIVIPLAYVWWILGLYYHVVPQLVLWILLIIIVLFTAIRGMLIKSIEPLERTYIPKIPQGPIENLSVLVKKQKLGIYYKWLIANRLGKLARELLDQRSGQRVQRRFSRLTGWGQNPSSEVDAYLESGLNGSFADYPQSRWSRPQAIPLDSHPVHIVEFLESEMETHRNGNR